MKKSIAFLLVFSVFALCLKNASNLNAQETTANAGLAVPEQGIRTGEEGETAV